MNTQRIVQLLVSFLIITTIALVSERSRVLASIITVMPLNVTLGLWFIYTSGQGDTSGLADFSRMVLLGLIPTALFIFVCWYGFKQEWPFGRVIVVGYAVWLVAILIYRFIESQVHLG
jgi:uncharacterized membrane protein (GlpM family)